MQNHTPPQRQALAASVKNRTPFNKHLGVECASLLVLVCVILCTRSYQKAGVIAFLTVCKLQQCLRRIESQAK